MLRFASNAAAGVRSELPVVASIRIDARELRRMKHAEARGARKSAGHQRTDALSVLAAIHADRSVVL